MKQNLIRGTITVLAASILCLCLLAGCGVDSAPQQSDPDRPGAAGTAMQSLPDHVPTEFTFSSGAGGWRTYLRLEKDGSFTGEYTDWDAGGAPEHLNGHYYICTFSGQFGNLRQLENGSFSLTLDNVISQQEPDTQWVEDDCLYTASIPFGIEGGTEFLLYPPETPTADLPEDFLLWWPSWNVPQAEASGALECWGLRNCQTEAGFFHLGSLNPAA